MAYFEIGNDPSFEDIRRFTRNILQHLPDSSQFKGSDVQVAYLQSLSSVLVAEKVHEAVALLAAKVDEAKESSSADAAAGLAQSRRMVAATWGLVGGTFALAVATVFLVVYTRQLTFVD